MTSEQPGPTADSVRLAWPTESPAIADVQRRAWRAHLPPEVSASLLGEVDAEEMSLAWHAAITRPPEARCRVLVAVEQHRVAGFATVLPNPDPDADPGADGLIEEFVIDPPAERRGHGSRLLNACVDTLRADGFTRAHRWVTATDDAVRRFLTAAGWDADGSWREIGREDEQVRVKQIRLHSDISGGDI